MIAPSAPSLHSALILLKVTIHKVNITTEPKSLGLNGVRKSFTFCCTFVSIFFLTHLLTYVKRGQRRQRETAPEACEARAAGTRK